VSTKEILPKVHLNRKEERTLEGAKAASRLLQKLEAAILEMNSFFRIGPFPNGFPNNKQGKYRGRECGLQCEKRKGRSKKPHTQSESILKPKGPSPLVLASLSAETGVFIMSRVNWKGWKVPG